DLKQRLGVVIFHRYNRDRATCGQSEDGIDAVGRPLYLGFAGQADALALDRLRLTPGINRRVGLDGDDLYRRGLGLSGRLGGLVLGAPPGGVPDLVLLRGADFRASRLSAWAVVGRRLFFRRCRPRRLRLALRLWFPRAGGGGVSLASGADHEGDA